MSDVKSRRTDRDVALELTQLYVHKYSAIELEDIEDAYARFYALSGYLSSTDTYYLKSLIREEILSKLEK